MGTLLQNLEVWLKQASHHLSLRSFLTVQVLKRKQRPVKGFYSQDALGGDVECRRVQLPAHLSAAAAKARRKPKASIKKVQMVR